MDLGARIKNLRLDRGLTAYRLATLAGMTQKHLTDIENGNVRPRIDTLEKIIPPLGCTMAEFFNEDAEIYYLTSAEKHMLSQFRALSEDEQKLLSDTISMVFRTHTR